MRGTTRSLLTWFGAAGFVACVAVAHTRAQHNGNPFIDHGDNGETIHVLPAPAALHNAHFDQPTDFDPIAASGRGAAVFAASYGSGKLTDHGGPEVSNAQFRAIYWNSSVASSTATRNGLTISSYINGFISVFASGQNYSQSLTDDYTIVQQYGSRNAISASLPNLGFRVDTQATSSRITDSGIRTYLTSLFDAGKETPSANTLFGVYFPSGMRISLQGGGSCSAFCGYHSHFTYNSTVIKYAVFPYTDCRACSVTGKTVADILTIVTSHEIREAVTDPLGSAWYDSQGYEADDKCAWHNLYQTHNGGYWVQPEYSNGGVVKSTTYPGPGCVVPK